MGISVSKWGLESLRFMEDGDTVSIPYLSVSGNGGLTAQIAISMGNIMINYCIWGTLFSDKPIC